MLKLIIAACLLWGSMALTGCAADEPVLQSTAPEAMKLQSYSIQTTRTNDGKIYTGTVEAMESTQISTRSMGWIETITVKEGHTVKRGQILATLRNKDLEAQQFQAQAAIAEAKAFQDNAKRNYERLQTLFAKKAVTQKELDDVTSALRQAEAQYQAARGRKQEIDEYLRYSLFRAPFNGLVARKFVDRGDLANPGQPIVEIQNVDKMKIIVKVPETDIVKLKPGMPARVKVWALENSKAIDGIIDRISPAGDHRSRQFEIIVTVENPSQLLKSGMFVRVTIGLEGLETMLIPIEATFRRGQLQGVFVIDAESTVHLRWIRTGKSYGDYVEVLAGLEVGDLIVANNQNQLYDGQMVEVQK